MTFVDRIASAPISWGICEVPGWGHMLPTDRVLSEMTGLGISATEYGAPGFLPTGSGAIRGTLDRHGMSLLGGFTPLVLHDPARAEGALAHARAVAELFSEAGATTFSSNASRGTRGAAPTTTCCGTPPARAPTSGSTSSAMPPRSGRPPPGPPRSPSSRRRSRARTHERTSVIVVDVRESDWTEGGLFWQVGVPEVSDLASVREARARHDAGMATQRRGI